MLWGQKNSFPTNDCQRSENKTLNSVYEIFRKLFWVGDL